MRQKPRQLRQYALQSRQYVLREMGLIETLCFLETNDNTWWFLKDGVVTCMLIGTKRSNNVR